MYTVIVAMTFSLGFSPGLELFGEIQEAEAAKAEGVFVKKYGSSTTGIVCGDKLCSDTSTTNNRFRAMENPYSPLGQFYYGVSLNLIHCNDGLELVFKSSNWYPACVSPTSADRLIEIGWAVSLSEKVEIINIAETSNQTYLLKI
jgi:hypothetical protein